MEKTNNFLILKPNKTISRLCLSLTVKIMEDNNIINYNLFYYYYSHCNYNPFNLGRIKENVPKTETCKM